MHSLRMLPISMSTCVLSFLGGKYRECTDNLLCLEILHKEALFKRTYPNVENGLN